MKTIEIPENLQFTILAQNGPVNMNISFAGWLESALDQDESLCKGLKNLAKGIRLHKLVENAENALTLEDVDYDCLKTAVDNAKFIGQCIKHLGPFVEALEKAQTPKPAEAAKG